MSFFGVLCALVLSAAPFLHAAESEETASGRIVSVEVTGLKRTKPHIAQYALERFIGTEAAALDENAVRAAIIETGVLNPLSVEVTSSGGEGAVLKVTVKEKWAIIPLPAITMDSDAKSFGLFVLDNNAFGLRDQAVVGGMAGTAGWFVMGRYQNTPDKKGRPGWSVQFVYDAQKVKDTDREGTKLRSYDPQKIIAAAELTYPVTHYFSPFFNSTFNNFTAENTWNVPSDDDFRGVSFTPGITLRDSTWDGYLMSERSLLLSYSYHFAILGDSFHEFKAKGVFTYSLLPGFLATLRGGVLLRPGAGFYFEGGAKQVQVDVLPGNFAALHHAGGSAGFEKSIIRAPFGTISAAATWQYVYSWGGIADAGYAHGPAGSVCLYLNGVAIPVLSLGLAYNMVTYKPQFVLNLGVQF